MPKDGNTNPGDAHGRACDGCERKNSSHADCEDAAWELVVSASEFQFHQREMSRHALSAGAPARPGMSEDKTRFHNCDGIAVVALLSAADASGANNDEADVV